MVTRKVLPLGSAVAPVSNTGSGGGGGFAANDVPDVLRPGRKPVPSTATNQYANFETEEELAWRQTEQQQQQQPAELPAGCPTGAAGTEALSATANETNPFKRKALPDPATSFPAVPTNRPPVPLPPPSSELSQLSLNEPDNNPWQPALPKSSRHTSPAPPVSIPDAKNVWVASEGSSERPSRQPSPADTRVVGQPSLEAGLPNAFDAPEDSAGWNEVAPSSVPATAAVQVNPAGEAAGEGWNLVDVQGSPALQPLSRQSTWENFTDDEDDTAEPTNMDTDKNAAKGKSVAENGSGPAVPEPASNILIQIDSPAASPIIPGTPDNQSRQDNQTGQTKVTAGPVSDDAGPKTAPSEARPSSQPPVRSMLDVGNDAHTPSRVPTSAEGDKSGTYQIKNITWHDARASKNPRISPILLQNANGPCPLVALVNALTLTTPAEASTGLVDALRSREQVSLTLLLNAVFDELMSTRRAESEHELPDVDELYSFLKSLDTGMNVNPRYIPTPDVVAAFRRSSLTHLHPTERDGAIPGSFENTREMKLYSTFGIPLIHGWLPAPTEGVYAALSRHAASYEDVQNLLFREEELEDKLSSPSNAGLTEEEQHLYHDILEIKTFLHVSATQLTQYGLDVIRRAMRPGSFAILFRNDHFSTLYRHPDTLQLLSLVTDAGYATHDEVIWETLVDINGEHADFYSGDFRLVGGNGGSSQQQAGQQENDNSSRSRSRGKSNAVGQPEEGTGAGPDHEQEDRDLALALQLQEEEEERQRAEEARRRRESELSEQFIEQQARRPGSVSSASQPSNAAGGGRYNSGSPALAPPRRSSASVAAGNRASHGRTGSQQLQPALPPRRQQHEQQPALPPRRSQQQHVRPLVPPLEARPPIHRPVDPDADDGDEAPPSYEQASKQAPYHPPPGAPGSDRPVMASGSGANGRYNAASPRPRPGVSPASGRPYVTPGVGVYASQPPRPQPQNNRDNDCVIM